MPEQENPYRSPDFSGQQREKCESQSGWGFVSLLWSGILLCAIGGTVNSALWRFSNRISPSVGLRHCHHSDVWVWSSYYKAGFQFSATTLRLGANSDFRRMLDFFLLDHLHAWGIKEDTKKFRCDWDS
jgi:hypothetical protein